MISDSELLLYGGTYLNKGGAAIAYGTFKVLREIGIKLRYIVDAEPYFPYNSLDLKPIYRYSDILCSRQLPSLNPVYVYRSFFKCLFNSFKQEIRSLRGMPIWHIGDSPFSDSRSMLSIVGQVVALQSLGAVVNRKAIIGGVSLGYPRTKIGRIALQRFFKKDVAHIFIRGDETQTVLQKLGAPSEKMTIICDFAFHLKKKEGKNTNILSRLIRESNKPPIALIFREYSRGKQREKYIKHVRELVYELEKRDYSVFFIPTSYSYLLEENDLTFLEKVLGVNPNRIINIRDLMPEEIISVFSSFDAVISVRLHGAIYGALANVPTIHLYESSKSLEVIGNMFGNTIPLIKLSDFSNGYSLDETLDTIINRRDEIAAQLRLCVDKARKSSIDKLKIELNEKHLLEDV